MAESRGTALGASVGLVGVLTTGLCGLVGQAVLGMAGAGAAVGARGLLAAAMASTIQSRSLVTRAYTPGRRASAQPIPQLTMPARKNLPEGSSQTRGPPESPWETKAHPQEGSGLRGCSRSQSQSHRVREGALVGGLLPTCSRSTCGLIPHISEPQSPLLKK